jgi:hypothetical protein
LFTQCRGSLALPDVVITAVGTKVWRLAGDKDGSHRALYKDKLPKWEEDTAW